MNEKNSDIVTTSFTAIVIGIVILGILTLVIGIVIAVKCTKSYKALKESM
jgi:tetrahydromethanopterin S-methyltransferase subunit B